MDTPPSPLLFQSPSDISRFLDAKLLSLVLSSFLPTRVLERFTLDHGEPEEPERSMSK